ncbi:MAG: hypothetical protein JNM93_13415 [Bacteriovoracaceae bacterium]|nr:hypothetical protein [Bacteriovoracaceae bacterium]
MSFHFKKLGLVMLFAMLSFSVSANTSDVLALEKIIEHMLDSGEITEEQALKAKLRLESNADYKNVDKSIQNIQKSFKDKIEPENFRNIASEKN